MKFSVLMSIYYKEEPEYFHRALQSIWDEQSLKPDEIVLVQDGPLTEALYSIINEWKKKLGDIFKTISLEQNMGLGIALNEGLKRCQFSWVARMDSDDIALPERFQVQVNYLKRNPKTDVMGSWISEFSDDPDRSSGERRLPCDHNGILKYAKYRNPLNHMTVMFRKKAVEDTGGYLPMNGFEDYYLWIRMLKKGYKFANLNQILVKARTGKSMILRRKGWNYVKNEWHFEKAVWELGFFSSYEFFRNILFRSIPRLLPTFFVYRLYTLLRTR